MNILFVNMSGKAEGGAEIYLHSLARRIGEKGCAASILCRDKCEVGDFPGGSFAVPSLWDRDLILREGTKRAVDGVLAETSPDVVFVNKLTNGRAIEYFAAKSRTMVYAHDYKFVDPDGKMLLYNPLEANTKALSSACLLRAYTRRSMPRDPVKAVRAYLRAKRALEATKRMGRVIVASGHMKRVLLANGVDGARIEVLPYFVDYDIDSGIDPPYGSHILFSGRLAEGKGLDVLLEALKDVKNGFILDVAGSGPMEDLYRSKARELGIGEKVVFHGWLDRARLAELYKKALFLAVPSVWPEPFGICGIEAAYFGKPAVAFDVGGISDWLIDGETGFLVKPYDKQEMASRISHLLNNPDMVRGLGARARELAMQKYNPENHINRLLEIFKGCE